MAGHAPLWLALLTVGVNAVVAQVSGVVVAHRPGQLGLDGHHLAFHALGARSPAVIAPRCGFVIRAGADHRSAVLGILCRDGYSQDRRGEEAIGWARPTGNVVG
jgi:hypothetical protein